MKSSLRRQGLRYPILVLLVILFVPACGGDAEDETATTTTTTSVPEQVAETQYSIVKDASYLNVRVGGTRPVEASDDPELGDWIYATGPIGAEGPAAGFIIYRRYTQAGREDLAVLLTPSDAVDAIRLTGDTSGVHLGLSCDDGAVVLTPDGVPMDSTNHHDLESAIRAWKSGPDGDIEEFDPATGDSMGSC